MRIDKFSARARAYICTYYNYLDKIKSAAADVDALPGIKEELMYKEIERLVKAFKGHRCALDFDRGFINSQLREHVQTTIDADGEVDG